MTRITIKDNYDQAGKILLWELPMLKVLLLKKLVSNLNNQTQLFVNVSEFFLKRIKRKLQLSYQVTVALTLSMIMTK